MTNQTVSRINFSDSHRELKYLFQHVQKRDWWVTIINRNNDYIISPHYEDALQKDIGRMEKMDLAFEYIAFWLKDTLFLQWIAHLLDTWIRGTIITSPSLWDESILKENLKIELKKVERTLRKRMFQIPIYVWVFVFLDSINQLVPWFFPLVSLFTLKTLFSLPSKYRKEIKKIQQLSLQLDSFELNLKVLPELESVEQHIWENDFRKAIKTVDDLDWIINQEEFSDEMLMLAEYFEILEQKSHKADTIKYRGLSIFSYTFYKEIFYKLLLA